MFGALQASSNPDDSTGKVHDRTTRKESVLSINSERKAGHYLCLCPPTILPHAISSTRGLSVTCVVYCIDRQGLDTCCRGIEWRSGRNRACAAGHAGNRITTGITRINHLMKVVDGFLLPGHLNTDVWRVRILLDCYGHRTGSTATGRRASKALANRVVDNARRTAPIDTLDR